MRTFKNSNLIEGLWSSLKYYAHNVYNTVPSNASQKQFLYESLWRKFLNDCRRD